MCGIVGMLATNGQRLEISAEEMAYALRLLQHRGPDAQQLAAIERDGAILCQPIQQWENGTSSSAQGYLGHARLKILDLSDAANQPFRYLSPNGKEYWIVYNGEVYNYRQLRQDLERQGYRFETDCDMEVFPALYDRLGVRMAAELNGMFAFAIWDVQEKQLYVARDRYGIKPLYVSILPNGSFAFASEVKSLLAMPGISRQLNCQALYEHFTFQFALAGQTFFQSIDHFPKGHYAVFHADTGRYDVTEYWRPVFHVDSSMSEQDWFRAIQGMLGRAVESQLQGDVTVGSFLSGGMDSGAIAAFASRQKLGLSTVSCGFDTSQVSLHEWAFDERDAARALSASLNTTHHEQVITDATLPSILDTVVWHLDDFQAGISYQNLVAAGLARQHMGVILSGVGGDELFAGYPWRYRLAMGPDVLPEGFGASYYRQWVRLLDDSEKRKFFSNNVLTQLRQPDTCLAFQSAFGRIAGTPLQQALGFDMQYFLPALLTVEDRLSMAFGLESRVPFLDNGLVDLCLKMPDSMKLRSFGDNQEPIAKWGLRRAMENILPNWVLNAPKQGFTPPDASWYRGPLSSWVEGRLFSESFLASGLFQPDELKMFWRSHLSGERNYRFLIWSLICLESWQRQFLDTAKPSLALRAK